MKIIKTNQLVIGVLFLALFATAVSYIDQDFLWHIRNGSEILNGKFSLLDQYSYTMPSFHFVNHSWATSVIWSIVYSKLNLGYIGLAVFSAILGTAAVLIASGNILWLAPLIAESSLFGFGVRTHIVSFLFLSILILLFRTYKRKGDRFLFLLPILFTLWANMHGGFILGVFYIWGYFFVDILFINKNDRTKREKINLLLVFLLSTACTFLTPYNIGTWEEALRTINNPILKNNVAEWQHTTIYTSFSFFMLVPFFLISVWKTRKINFQVLFTAFLLVESILSVRVVPLFCLSVSFVIRDFIEEFRKNKKVDENRLNTIFKLFLAIAVVIFIIDTIVNVRARLLVKDFIYPTNAVEYISNHGVKGNIFSVLHWNNYLLFKTTNIKTFLDGRMMVWSQPARENELSNAFQTYINITTGRQDVNEILNKYCVGTFMWLSHEATGWPWRNQTVDITKELNKDEWKPIYNDNFAVIYERELPSTCSKGL